MSENPERNAVLRYMARWLEHYPSDIFPKPDPKVESTTRGAAAMARHLLVTMMRDINEGRHLD